MQSIDYMKQEWILEENEFRAPRLKGSRTLCSLPIVYLWTKEDETWKRYKNFLYEENEYLYFAIKKEFWDDWKKAVSTKPKFDRDDFYLDHRDDGTCIHDFQRLEMLLGKK